MNNLWWWLLLLCCDCIQSSVIGKMLSICRFPGCRTTPLCVSGVQLLANCYVRETQFSKAATLVSWRSSRNCSWRKTSPTMMQLLDQFFLKNSLEKSFRWPKFLLLRTGEMVQAAVVVNESAVQVIKADGGIRSFVVKIVCSPGFRPRTIWSQVQVNVPDWKVHTKIWKWKNIPDQW